MDNKQQTKASNPYLIFREEDFYWNRNANRKQQESTPSSYSWFFKLAAILCFTSLQFFIICTVLDLWLPRIDLDYSVNPEQIHLSLGRKDGEYIVTWATKNPAKCYLLSDDRKSEVFGLTEGRLSQVRIENKQNDDTSRLFSNDYGDSISRYFHLATLNLDSVSAKEIQYYISCDQDGTSWAQSPTFNLRPIRFEDETRALNVVFLGDFGLVNGRSEDSLIIEANSGENDLFIHNGDFAYDLNTDEGKYGDKFMRKIQPFAAQVPYMTSVGNHEVASNFSHYDKRFHMINRGPVHTGEENNFYYSYNAGPVHFIAISTEFYYFLDYSGLAPLVKQYEWLRADLEFATRPTERAKRPWIIVYGHRPMYCSSRDKDDCTKDSNLLRRGVPFTHAYALEKLFYDYGVDVELYSHEHQYERFLPIYDGKVYNGTDKPNDPYFNPRAPVHLISGSAGCQEKLDPFTRHSAVGSIKRVAEYGYTKIRASHCQIQFKQLSVSGRVLDGFVIEKNRQNFGNRSMTYSECV